MDLFWIEFAHIMEFHFRLELEILLLLNVLVALE